MVFDWKDAEKLKLECAEALRKKGIKTPSSGLRKRKRKRFVKPDDSKIRSINSKASYWDWVEQHEGKEPLEANPDFFEDIP